MNITQICSRKLKLLREGNNYTQEYVADYLDISQNAYSLLEKGKTKITLDRLESLAKLYHIQPAELISDGAMSMGNSDENGGDRSNFPPAISSFEKMMYEQTSNRLQVDIEKLYSILSQLTSNISLPTK